MLKFAIIQIGFSVFAVGESREMAIQEAQEWAENIEIIPFNAAVFGDMVCVPCTERLVAEVARWGGDVDYTIEYGIADVE